MWHRFIRNMSAGLLLIAGLASAWPAAQAAASSQVVSATACVFSGSGAPPSNLVIDSNGAYDFNGAVAAAIVCPIATDPATRNLKVTVFYDAYSSFKAKLKVPTTVLDCTINSKDRASMDIISGEKSLLISGEHSSVGNMSISLSGVHKINNLYCILPPAHPLLLTIITGYQVDQS